MTPSWIPRIDPIITTELLPDQPPPNRIKVLHVITKFTTGAGGNTLLSAIGMDPTRYEVWIASSAGGELWDRAERAGVRMVVLKRFKETISPLMDLFVLWQLIRLIRRERFAIVHTHTSKGGFVGRMAARMCRTPVVVHTLHAFSFHDYMSKLRRALYLFLERRAKKYTHAFMAVAPRVAEEAVERRVAPAGMINVIPSAVDLDDVPMGRDVRARAELGISNGAPLIGTVGRISFQKSPLDFVRMAAIVSKRSPEARFVMIGDGPMMHDVRTLADELGVDIILPGFIPDAYRFTAAFDVFVMPSKYEGLGRALTEALASGRPVVASAVNGVPDLVLPGATGLLTRPNDPAAVAECVQWLLDHPREAEAMGDQGRAAVRALFHPSVMSRAIDQTYRKLLGLPIEAPVQRERRIVVLPDTRSPIRVRHGR